MEVSMPFVDHNESWVPDAIKREAERTKDLLRKLRHAVEQGHLYEPPLNLLSDLGRHAALLALGIHQYTVRHDFVEPSGSIHHSEFEDIVAFASNEARNDPGLLNVPVPHEYDLYQALGFSDQEYKDLLVWKKAWHGHEVDMKGAFDIFSSEVVSELQAARYSIKTEDIVPGVAGVVGIALDVGFFAATAAVPALVSSCATGIAAIAAKFPEVRRKLLGRGW